MITAVKFYIKIIKWKLNLKLTEDQIIVYLKGSYGVSNGSIENLVFKEFLINNLKKINFQLIDNLNFIDDLYSKNQKNFKNMNNSQKKVSSYYTSYIFIKQ